jgi:hypothetical protein
MPLRAHDDEVGTRCRVTMRLDIIAAHGPTLIDRVERPAPD